MDVIGTLIILDGLGCRGNSGDMLEHGIVIVGMNCWWWWSSTKILLSNSDRKIGVWVGNRVHHGGMIARVPVVCVHV